MHNTPSTAGRSNQDTISVLRGEIQRITCELREARAQLKIAAQLKSKFAEIERKQRLFHDELLNSAADLAQARHKLTGLDVLIAPLTPRQIEIRDMIRVEHLLNKEISDRLNISHSTVKYHVAGLFKFYHVTQRHLL